MRVLPSLAIFGAVAVYLLLPMLAVLLYSLATRWTAHILPDGYTLGHWRESLGDARIAGAFVRSIALAATVVGLDLVLVVPAAYWARVRNPRIRTVVELAAAIPFALPYVVIAFGILQLTGEIAPFIQGTPLLLAFGHAAIAFPFLYWAVDAAMAATGIERLSEAAQACGASPLQIIRRVVLPNITPGLIAGGILVFGVSFNEFALAQILSGAAFETVPLWSADALVQTEGRFNALAVVTFATFLVLFALSAAAVYVGRRQTFLLPGVSAVARARGRAES
ncbi:MAG TPA: ABC transporter permease subunit [Candidatus Limnocylindria bacterium]|nr:ABC transporter permease subunit [Candidatus Limnocylindria bacterium]